MDVQVGEGTWSVQSTALEILPVEIGTLADSPYPLPRLKGSGRTTMSSLRTVFLENDFVRVVLCPDLGGRVVEFVDKRTGIDVISLPNQIELTPGSSRGFFWRHGIEIYVGEDPKANALGQVSTMLRGDLGAVFLHELVLGTPLSCHTCVSLQPGETVVSFEVRLSNASLEPVTCPSGLRVESEGAAKGWVYDVVRDSGLHFAFREGALVAEGMEAGLALRRVKNSEDLLGPLEVDSWKVDLVPFSGLGRLDAAHRFLGAHVGEKIRIQSTKVIEDAKLYVLDGSGGTFEAEAPLRPQEMFVGDLGFRVQGLVVKTSDGKELLRVPVEEAAAHTPVGRDLGLQDLAGASRGDRPGSIENTFYESVRSNLSVECPPFALRSAASLWNAILAVRKADFLAATDLVDDALLRDGENAFAWWLRAVCERHLAIDNGDRAAILNVHFLTPLEPSLRSEAFLAQSAGEEALDVTLLKPLLGNPDDLLSVLCTYCDLELYKDAARLMDALPKDHEIALVRYLNAWVHLRATKYESEAAHHVQQASQLPLAPPFPWRPIEIRAIQELKARFPLDEQLRVLGEMVQAFALT